MPQLYPLQKIRVGMQQFAVSFGRGTELAGDQPGLSAQEFLFGEFSAPVSDVYVLLIQAVQIIAVQSIEFAVFQQFYILVARLVVDIAFHGDHGLSFPAEPKSDFMLMLVSIGPNNAFFDKVDVLFNPPGLQENGALWVADRTGIVLKLPL